MKKIILGLGLISIIGCASLGKEEKEYKGTWLLKEKTGGIAGLKTKPEKETKMVIKAGKIKRYEGSILISSEPFKIEKTKVIHSSQPENVIVSNKLMKEAINKNGDTLWISQQCYDCYVFKYEKMK